MALVWSDYKDRQYPSVSENAVSHREWDATVTLPGDEDDVWTAMADVLQTIQVTAPGSEDDVWTFSYAGRSGTYTVLNGDDATDVATAIEAIIEASFVNQLVVARTTDTLKITRVDGTDADLPELENDGDGTATAVAGAKYEVVLADTATLVADGIAAAVDLFPVVAAINTGAELTITSTRDLSMFTGLPVVSCDGTGTIGAQVPDADADAVGFATHRVGRRQDV